MAAKIQHYLHVLKKNEKYHEPFKYFYNKCISVLNEKISIKTYGIGKHML